MSLHKITSYYVKRKTLLNKCHGIAGKIFILALLLLLVACQPAVSTPPPTPQVLRIAYPIALDSWGASLHRCVSSLPLIGLVVDEVPADLLDTGTVDLALQLGLPEKPSAYAAVIGWDEVILVVNPAIGQISLSTQTVAEIYNGKITHWGDANQGSINQPIQVWSYPLGDELRQVFLAAFLDGKDPAAPVYLAPDVASMLEAISTNTGAIGYLLKSQLTDLVHAVNLSDGGTNNKLRQPVLALTQGEPQGNLRQLLLCLQKP